LSNCDGITTNPERVRYFYHSGIASLVRKVFQITPHGEGACRDLDKAWWGWGLALGKIEAVRLETGIAELSESVPCSGPILGRKVAGLQKTRESFGDQKQYLCPRWYLA